MIPLQEIVIQIILHLRVSVFVLSCPHLTSVRAAIIVFVEERVLAIVNSAHQAPFALLVAVAVT